MKWIVADPEHLGGAAGRRHPHLHRIPFGVTRRRHDNPRVVHAYPTLTEQAVRGALEELAQSKELTASSGILLDENLPEGLIEPLRLLGHAVDSVVSLRLMTLRLMTSGSLSAVP